MFAPKQNTIGLDLLKKQVFTLTGVADEALWKELSALFRLQELNKGAFFSMAGETSYAVGFITNGLARSYFMDSQGKEATKYFHEAGTFIGPYTSLISGEPGHVYIQALKKTTLFQADYRQVNALCDQFPSLHIFFRRLAEYLLIKKEKREFQLLQMDAREKYQIFQKQFPGLEQQIPQYYIASYLGISATQLSRIRAGKK